MRIIIFTLTIAVLIIVVILKSYRSIYPRGLRARSGGNERELYQKLLRKAFGDKSQAERLIEVERRKKPDAGKAVWMKDAIERWESHNRLKHNILFIYGASEFVQEMIEHERIVDLC